MLISYKHEFLFIHIPKVAGTSIRNALRPYQTPPYVWVAITRRLGIATNYKLHIYPDHASTLDIQENIPPETFTGFYKFAFVRHPLDRQVSQFFHGRKDRGMVAHELYKGFKDFDEYIRWKVVHNIVFQKEFITDEQDNIIVDFVGRYENLNADFQYICDQIGIKSTLPHKNTTQHKPWQEYYTPETLALAHQAFAPDLEFFDYD